jgi:Bestrophin, RFP-TM, chloride channel
MNEIQETFHSLILYLKICYKPQQVLPYCIFNVIVTAIIHYLDKEHYLKLAISDKGHAFMNLMVAFSIVSRVTISMGRYNEARGFLGDMYRETRAVVQNMVLFSDSMHTEEVKAWRNLVAYRANLMLRTAMAAIDYTDPPHTHCWELMELSDEEKIDIQKYIFCDTGKNNAGSLRWGHGHRTMLEENMRVPIRMAFKLRQALRLHKTLFVGQNAIPMPQELKLMGSVDSFMQGYFG